MSQDTHQDGSREVERTPSLDNVRWTTCSLEDFTDLYWNEIAPCLEAEDIDPKSEKPTHQWFRDHDARSFLAALRRHQDRSFGEFWNQVLGLGDNDEGYAWATDDQETIDALKEFLDRRKSRYDLSTSSINTLRTRLNLYVRAYREANGTGDLLTPVKREQKTPAYEAVDACYAAFDWLNEKADHEYSAQTLQRVRRVVDAWYQHLVGRRIASMNPASGLYEEFKWELEESPTPALSVEHVQKLMQAATTTRDQLLVVALAGWGLRASEVAALQLSQFNRDVPEDDVPFIAFENRKNGPGEVSLLYGLDILDWHDFLLEAGVVLIAPYNPRNTTDPLEIEYRVEDRISEFTEDVTLKRSILTETYKRRTQVERTFGACSDCGLGTLRARGRVHGRVQTYLGLCLRVIVAITNYEQGENPGRTKLVA